MNLELRKSGTIPENKYRLKAFNPQKRIDGMDEFLHRMLESGNPEYWNPWTGIDYSPTDILKNNKVVERAIWSYAEGAITQPTILPTYLSEDFTYALPTDAPAYMSIPKRADKGATIEYVRVTAYGSPTSYMVTDTATPDYVSPTTARATLRKRICETWGGVTGFVQASGKNWKDMLAEAHQERLRGMLTDALEDECLNGDNTGNNAKGFLTYQGTTNGVNVGGDGTEVTLEDIREAIKLAFDAGGDLESYGFAITDPRTHKYVKSLVSEDLGYARIGTDANYDLPWGLKTYAIDGVPFIKSRKMPSDANAKKILFLDHRHCYAAILQDITTELYGKTKDATDFAIKWYGNFVNRCPEHCAVVYGCA